MHGFMYLCKCSMIKDIVVVELGPTLYPSTDVELALCLGSKRKASGAGPRIISLSLIQSATSGEAIKVSKSLRPINAGGRSLTF